MNKNTDTPSSLMGISTQQIKTEPPDEAIIEEMNISKLFENELPGLNEYTNVSIIRTEIVREDAEADEIVKEEPRFGDEFEELTAESTLTVRDEIFSERTASLADGSFQKLMVKSNEVGLQTKHQLNSAVPKRSSAKNGLKKGAKKGIQSRPATTKTASSSSSKIHSRRQPKTPSAAAPKPSSKMNFLENPTFKCFLCKATASSASNLKRHYDRFHGEKVFHCNLCSKRFSVKFSLDLHKRSHSGAKPFQCKICQREFATQNNLRRHNESCWPMNAAAPKSAKVNATAKASHRDLQCYLCKFHDDFNTIQHLQVHMITKHTGGNILPCNVCRRIFSTQSDLAQHMLGHTKHKPFECDTCNMRFTTKRNVKRHKRLHTRIGMFECSECGKEYTTKFARDAHQKKHGKI